MGGKGRSRENSQKGFTVVQVRDDGIEMIIM